MERFADLVPLWKGYLNREMPALTSEDARWHLAGEVRDRLLQLDIVLDHVGAALERFRATEPDDEESHRAWYEIFLFTEMFYFVAWRLVEVLNRRQPLYRFPKLGKVEAAGIRRVRNDILEHPERAREVRRNESVGDTGPALRTKGIVIVSRKTDEPARVFPSEDSPDRGLFTNASELFGELTARLSREGAEDHPPH